MQHRDGAATALVRAAIMWTAVGTVLACSKPTMELGSTSYPGAPVIIARSLSVTPPPDACPGSVRASLAGPNTFAAWWRVRPDSSSDLVAGRSSDGGSTWAVTATVDTLDTSRKGCDRPPPSVFADSATDYFDVAYFLEAREGPGIFFSHTMNAQRLGSTEGIFHSPIAIMYGVRPSRVAVVATGDDVAVAYEDPNAERPVVGLALSRTMGHIFDTRTQISSSDLPAVDPSVALSGHTVTVQWMERPDSLKTGGRVAIRRVEWR